MRLVKYLNGEKCPACGGTGKIHMERDAHRSAGIVPCRFSTSRKKKGMHGVQFTDLRCSGGTLTRDGSVPEPEKSSMNARDERTKRERRNEYQR